LLKQRPKNILKVSIIKKTEKMKNYFKVIWFVFVVFGMFSLMSCESENETINENIIDAQSNQLIDECFLVRGDRGELLDLHIVRNEDNQVIITTSPSELKSTDEDIPEYIVIANNVEFIDNTFVLPETAENYWVFEVTLGDLNNTKAAPGGGTIAAECHCLAPSGNCTITYNIINNNVFTAQCFSSIDTPCSANGVGRCTWTLPEVVIKKTETTEKITTIIVQSDIIDFNGLLYE
jgi:hypothetical protein